VCGHFVFHSWFGSRNAGASQGAAQFLSEAIEKALRKAFSNRIAVLREFADAARRVEV
jgi:hypothetical protein